MTMRAGAALLFLAAALFLIANRAAYRGYFQDDELNNISWTRGIPAIDYAKAVLTPRFFTNNFRPVGHYYYRELSLLYGLDFPKYLPILHLVHILNVWLVWLLARRLGLPPLAASLGTSLFVYHLAAFDVYWKPMYVFDLFCTTFILASILLYARRQYILSFCAFWLAYKSKELAVMLPAVLACYEFWLVEKKSWKPLIPFFAVSISFGLQGVLLNPNVDNDYTFRFTPEAFWTSLSFYSSRIFSLPYGGLALIPLPLLVRDRRLWFGCAVLCLFFVPLMFLPGRLYPAYCYLPLTGLALMTAALASRKNLAPVVGVLCAVWIVWNIANLRKMQREALAIDNENRTYVAALANFARTSKDTRVFVYDGAPAGLHAWGIEGALYYLYGRAPELYSVADTNAAAALRRSDGALLQWNAGVGKLAVLPGDTALRLFGAGWYRLEGGVRWTAPHASATVTRPPGKRDFELTVVVPADQIGQTGPISVAVALNGVEIGNRRLTAEGQHTLRWPAPESSADQVSVEIDVTPEYRPTNGDTRRLGVAVLDVGFR